MKAKYALKTLLLDYASSVSKTTLLVPSQAFSRSVGFKSSEAYKVSIQRSIVTSSNLLKNLNSQESFYLKPFEIIPLQKQN